jgi:hypothetical protein
MLQIATGKASGRPTRAGRLVGPTPPFRLLRSRSRRSRPSPRLPHGPRRVSPVPPSSDPEAGASATPSLGPACGGIFRLARAVSPPICPTGERSGDRRGGCAQAGSRSTRGTLNSTRSSAVTTGSSVTS